MDNTITENLTNTIFTDLYRVAKKKDYLTFLKVFRRDPGFKFLVTLRLISKYSVKHPIGFLAQIFFRHFTFKYGFQIPSTVKIGKGLMLPHFGGIVINSKTIIGNYCNILHNVTIGNVKIGKNAGSPIIGNYVYFGPGSVIVGKIKIGNNVLIAPNAFVNINVPDNSIVIGNPCKITEKLNATEGYITNILL